MCLTLKENKPGSFWSLTEIIKEVGFRRHFCGWFSVGFLQHGPTPQYSFIILLGAYGMSSVIFRPATPTLNKFKAADYQRWPDGLWYLHVLAVQLLSTYQQDSVWSCITASDSFLTQPFTVPTWRRTYAWRYCAHWLLAAGCLQRCHD